MQAFQVKIGYFYRFKSSPGYGWFKVTRRFEAGQYIDGNGKRVRAVVFEGEHTIGKDETIGIIRAKLARELVDVAQ